MIEHCTNCASHNVHTRHNEQKYLSMAQQLRSCLSEASGQNVQALYNEVPKVWAEYEAYCQLIPDNDSERPCYAMIPRIGAFEVSYRGIIVYSKLLSTEWPHVPSLAKNIANIFADSAKMSHQELAKKYQIKRRD